MSPTGVGWFKSNKIININLRRTDVTYYEGVKKMEEMGVNDNYIQGWVAGYLQNPEIEEQRITDEWEAGYEDGQNHSEENFANYC